MTGVIGLGNALTDVMTRLSSDDTLAQLGLPKGSMQLVDEATSQAVMEKTAGLPKSISGGGSAANTINGVAKLGMKAGFIGVVGEDETGNQFRNDLLQNSITPSLFKGHAPSGRAIALVSPDSERTFATYLGCAIELSANHLSADLFKGYRILHIEGYLVLNHELMLSAAELAKQQGLLVSLDLASYNVVEGNLDFLHEYVRQYVDIVFANEEEAKAFCGAMPEQAVRELAELCDIAVVKTGKTGSLVMKDGHIYPIGVIEANSLDTTGAGDLYASGFLYGLLKELPPDACGKLGALLSGNVIEVLGSKMDETRWEKILQKTIGIIA